MSLRCGFCNTIVPEENLDSHNCEIVSSIRNDMNQSLKAIQHDYKSRLETEVDTWNIRFDNLDNPTRETFKQHHCRLDEIDVRIEEFDKKMMAMFGTPICMPSHFLEKQSREAWQQGCENHLNRIFKYIDELDQRLKKFETVDTDRPVEDMTTLDRECSLNKAKSAAFNSHLDNLRKSVAHISSEILEIREALRFLHNEKNYNIPSIVALTKSIESELKDSLKETHPNTIIFNEQEKLNQYKDRCEELLEKNHTQSKSIDVMFKKIHSHENKIEMLMECLDRKTTQLDDLKKEYEEANLSYIKTIQEQQSVIALQNIEIHHLQNPQLNPGNKCKIAVTSSGGGEGGSNNDNRIGVSSGGGRGGAYPDGKGNCT